jgi:Peptidase family M28
MAHRSPASASRYAAAIITLVMLVVLFWGAVEQIQPPAPVPANAPADQFSALRALENLREIARKPRPTGSEENARVREYLLSELQRLGLSPDTQTGSVARTDPRWGGRNMGATVNNVIGRLKGAASTRPLMLVAHYDSVPSGPGASDDGSGAATLLETARALESGPRLRNDVIFLFTDGEELGLLGAQAFVNEHPWAREPGVVLNFEARGACGPSFMFETSAENGWLVRQFAGASPYPAAASFAGEVYKRLPNDTDLTIFKRAGLAGLNFAYVGCFPRYHNMGDSLENLDLRSLQQGGSDALALARRFGSLDLTKTSAPDAVYFNLGRWIVRYPENRKLPILALALLLVIVVVAIGFRHERLEWGGITAGFIGWLAGTALATTACVLLWRGLLPTHFVSRLPYGTAYNGSYYAWAFVALAVAVPAAIYAGLFRRFNVESLALGALLWWVGFAVVISVRAPEASYLLLWPLVASLIEMAYAFARRHREQQTDGVLLWTLPAVVGILLFGALPYLLIMLEGTLAIVPLVVTVSLLVGFLVPQLHILAAPWRWGPAAAAALAALALIVAGAASSGYDADHPRADSIFYTLDAATGGASWVSADRAPDPWTAQFLTGRVEKGSLDQLALGPRSVIQSPAPAVALAPPDLTTLDDITIGDSRLMRFRLSFAPAARLVWVKVDKARVTEAQVNGKKITGSGSTPVAGWLLVYAAPPPAGLLLTLEVEASSSPVLRIFEDSDGLPVLPGMSFTPRPPDLMPAPMALPLDSSTVVSKAFEHFTMSHMAM